MSYARQPRFTRPQGSGRPKWVPEGTVLESWSFRPLTCSVCGESIQPFTTFYSRAWVDGVQSHVVCGEPPRYPPPVKIEAHPCEADGAAWCGDSTCGRCSFRGRGPRGGE